MNLEDLTNLEDLRHEWEHYQAEKTRLKFHALEIQDKRVAEYLSKAKNEFKVFFGGQKKFIINVLPKRIQAAYRNLKYELFYEEPSKTYIYEFGFSLLTNPRVNYSVAIVPTEPLVLSKPIEIRDEPNTIEGYNHDIKIMTEEYLHWQNIIKKIEETAFCYHCYNSENTKPDYANLKKYSSFNDILVEKLNLNE